MAECAVECGFTLEQARNHSPAQLRLLRSAANRLKADNVLASMNAHYAAFAAVMASNGRKVFKDLERQLKKSAEL